ncbi:hypothetical protein [Streptomyces erythrochromogenes]|uniref:hypothetical protein n=1 Tax=Streptomyces erythrochromogenes TaxID=285574 RepID=UPI0036AFE844
MSLRAAPGQTYRVKLCDRCALTRPGRADNELSAADLAWRASDHDATTLLAAFQDGSWTPSAGELEFAADLARMPWTESSLRTALRETSNLVYAGRLVRALDNNALVVLQHVPADDRALHAPRRLVDALADRWEGPPLGAA